jgi:hypothetical protein
MATVKPTGPPPAINTFVVLCVIAAASPVLRQSGTHHR